jgi:hypothetical protein
MIPIPVLSKEFVSCNILEIQVGTNCPQGGDTGHGGRTVLRLIDRASTDMRCRINDREMISAMGGSIEIVLGGDSECGTFIEALEFALDCTSLTGRREDNN